MWARIGCAAVFAALLLCKAALAQDVTLIARDGGLKLTGTLSGYDGEFYRLDTSYGALTVDGEGVICEGPGCPDLTAPRAAIRLTGEAAAGAALLPPLITAFAKVRGYELSVTSVAPYRAQLVDRTTAQVLADVSFDPADPDSARTELKAGRAELVVAAGLEPDLEARVVAMDALVAIVSPDNPTPSISTPDLAKVLSGEVKNWSEVGGPDMPLVLHALTEDADLSRALSQRLGRPIVASEFHADLDELARAVAEDPWAIAVTGQASVGGAKTLLLTDSCGFPLLPSRLAVKAGDYPLALPIQLLTPRRRLPLLARELLEFLATPPAQTAVATTGYVDRSVLRQPMTQDGLRLINAIQGAGEETTLEDLKALVDVMDGADRISFTFRFGGTAELDAASQENLRDLARMLEAGMFRDEVLVLAGFSDGTGDAASNLDLARERAGAVLSALADASPDLPVERMPRVLSFGEAMPIACDKTGPGRALNRRVELWVKPAFRSGDLPEAEKPPAAEEQTP